MTALALAEQSRQALEGNDQAKLQAVATAAGVWQGWLVGKIGSKPLGLALVAKMVDDHGGVVEYDSRPGRTIFRVLLPMSAEPGSAEPGSASTGRKTSARRRPGNGFTSSGKTPE